MIEEMSTDERYGAKALGFKAGFIADVQPGDVIILEGKRNYAVPRMDDDTQCRVFYVSRVIKQDASYVEDEKYGGEFVDHRVINLVVEDDEDIEHILAFGHLNGCYIWRLEGFNPPSDRIL